MGTSVGVGVLVGVGGTVGVEVVVGVWEIVGDGTGVSVERDSSMTGGVAVGVFTAGVQEEIRRIKLMIIRDGL